VELAENGLAPRMEQVYAQELSDLPPAAAKAG
jgi:hypothetical protein